MSGFYDEAAQKIGKNFDLLKDVVGKIGWAYRKNHTGLNYSLKKLSQKDSGEINSICREFYSHTLFSGYQYQKQERVINLKLQHATPVRQFFTGSWLEWYALSVVLEKMGQNQVQTFSCARSAKIRFANDDVHELDVMMLVPNKEPVIIECKTGEYRRDLNKYLELRKRIGIQAQNFIMLVTDIDDAQAKAFSSMYGLSFVTPRSLAGHLQMIL